MTRPIAISDPEKVQAGQWGFICCWRDVQEFTEELAQEIRKDMRDNGSFFEVFQTKADAFAALRYDAIHTKWVDAASPVGALQEELHQIEFAEANT